MKILKRMWMTLLFLSSLYSDNNRFFWDDWSTHQPVLYAIAISTSGPIIEFGCGYGSTDLLHGICEREERMLITLEDDWDWLNVFTQKYLGKGYNSDNSGWHKFYYVPGKKWDDPSNPSHWIDFMDQFEILSSLSFDVCFIDQAPWLARYETLKRMKHTARFVVIHDVDYFPTHHIFGKTIRPTINKNPGDFDFSDVFSTFRVYFPLNGGPPTLLGSNIENIFPTVNFSDPLPERD